MPGIRLCWAINAVEAIADEPLMTQELLMSWLREDLENTDLGGRRPDEIDEEGAVARIALQLSTGMTYVAWELLAIREAEVGRTPAETLEELGRIFHPPSE